MGGNGLIISQVHLDDVFVPESNRVGDEGIGLKNRSFLSRWWTHWNRRKRTGVMAKAFEESMNYAKQRVQFRYRDYQFSQITPIQTR